MFELLVDLVTKGNKENIQNFISNGGNVNQLNSWGQNVLFRLAQCHFQSEEILELLVENGVDVSLQCKVHEKPLHAAAFYGSVSMGRFLLQHGADVNANCAGQSPIYIAARHGYTEFVELLVEHGADLNEDDFRGTTPMHVACWCGHEKVVNLLIENGANTNQINVDGKSPLHHAANRNKLSVVKLLVKTGADLFLKERQGNSAYNLASLVGHKQTASFLLCAMKAQEHSRLVNVALLLKNLDLPVLVTYEIYSFASFAREYSASRFEAWSSLKSIKQIGSV